MKLPLLLLTTTTPTLLWATTIDSPSATDSSVRTSINFGPNLIDQSNNNNHIILSSFNAAASPASTNLLHHDHCYGVDNVDNCIGSTIAERFLVSLHPHLEFVRINHFISSNTRTYHAHYLQLHHGIPIANANLNINLDLTSGQIINYGDATLSSSDSTHSPSSSSRSGSLSRSVKQRISVWNDKVNQVVFGVAPSSSSADNDSPETATFSARPRANDPRHGLLTFLALSTDDYNHYLISTARSTVLDLLSTSGSESTLILISNAPSTVSPVKATLAYIHDGKDVQLTWKYEIETNENHYEAYVTADNEILGQEDVVQAIDWVRDYRPTGGELGLEQFQASILTKASSLIANSQYPPSRPPVKKPSPPPKAPSPPQPPKSGVKPSYKVFPWGTNDPVEGKRHLLTGSLVELDSAASPSGWHTVPALSVSVPEVYYDDTRGNNVVAQDNIDGGNNWLHNYRPHGGEDMAFDFHLGLPKAGTPLSPKSYINASVTELFYTCNEIHDLFYRYGFDEVSGNFQEYNFLRGGRGGDAVQANAQDGSGFNNANFATPPDGSRPRMRMYVWNQQQPYRDGDLEAGIVIHEFAHGISTRLTGGPANSGCLGWGEAGGMGEGWGDFFATMIRMHNANETEFAMGEWASGRPGGIRLFKYSTNMTVNTDTYVTLDKPGYFGVHAIGEVWAEMLFEVAELLIAEHGFSKTLFPPALTSASSSSSSTGFYNEKYKNAKVPLHGNTLAVQLVVDGMKLQPCRPSFMNARDAILAADKVLTGGDNACLIWKGFSKRGLGPAARVVGSTPWGGGKRYEDHTVPVACRA